MGAALGANAGANAGAGFGREIRAQTRARVSDARFGRKRGRGLRARAPGAGSGRGLWARALGAGSGRRFGCEMLFNFFFVPKVYFTPNKNQLQYLSNLFPSTFNV